MSAITAMPPPKPMLAIFKNASISRTREIDPRRSTFSVDGSRPAGRISFPLAREFFPATTIRFVFEHGVRYAAFLFGRDQL